MKLIQRIENAINPITVLQCLKRELETVSVLVSESSAKRSLV